MIDVPEELAASQQKFNGAAGRAFIAGLPRRAADFLERWELRVDGPSMYGVCALVLPVLRADGTPAALKLQPLDEESAGEPLALRRWDGAGAVRLLEHDEATCTLLLERLDEARSLAETPDTREAVLVVARLLARLTALPAPEGMRRLGDIAAAMLEQVPWAVRQLADPGDRRLVEDCAAAVREVAAEPGDRLLHWDLHFDNVLASHRAPWLAIDPKPLAGDPGFDLLPAIRNRFEPAEIRWRFDAMTEILGLDRERARAWSLARVLQNTLWDLADGRPLEAAQREIGRQLRER
ncbi:hydroxyurea phosphotransferase [Streptomyces avermitilis]|uniref:Hydroxyurea phosphotransferase n=1 Tax=Streptomyces avermitilis TaxID=33903 RepID=A0A4D4MX17_STRAX|nr:aminoglycoside phosphotransferase family protein [Streptomyces avermitilis]BBJ51917.1 hydroxyurea phosphotransferase [Streptomyces avermitilis]GDY63959.1 hydroxyurea phosphotransferase [Streptomyces avermitilis]GDY75889.1 hydroxyurea phosphotransferase [Streptomyces avermitilis]GDY84855.1 hydroxyurea phosphotransferase [Streptomyces avermitilis]